MKKTTQPFLLVPLFKKWFGVGQLSSGKQYLITIHGKRSTYPLHALVIIQVIYYRKDDSFSLFQLNNPVLC